jgi:molecular chaperone GrpE
MAKNDDDCHNAANRQPSPDQGASEVLAENSESRSGDECSVAEDTAPSVADLEAELEILRQGLAAERENYLRALAEVENTKRRAKEQQARIVEYANEQLLRSLLPVVDDLERALAGSDTSIESLRKGIELILQNFLAVLAEFGVEPMEVVGETFDPYQHEAVECVVTEEVPEQTIVGEIQRGYKYRDRLLRPARVRVSTRRGS